MDSVGCQFYGVDEEDFVVEEEYVTYPTKSDARDQVVDFSHGRVSVDESTSGVMKPNGLIHGHTYAPHLKEAMGPPPPQPSIAQGGPPRGYPGYAPPYWMPPHPYSSPHPYPPHSMGTSSTRYVDGRVEMPRPSPPPFPTAPLPSHSQLQKEGSGYNPKQPPVGNWTPSMMDRLGHLINSPQAMENGTWRVPPFL